MLDASTLDPARRAEVIRRAFPGTKVEAATVAEALRQAGADFRVELFPLMAVQGAEQAVDVPGKYAPCRLDTGAALGVVGQRYAVCQHAEAFAPADALVAEGRLTLEAVHLAEGGARARLVGLFAQSQVQRLDGASDVLAHFALFGNAHDGTGSTTAGLYTLRLRCTNGMTSRRAHGFVSLRHTRSIHDRIVDAQGALFRIREQAIRETEAFQALARSPMTAAQFRSFAEELVGDTRAEITDPTERLRSRREREVAELCRAFQSGQGNTGETAWDGYNGVTEWLDHQRGRLRTAAAFAKRWESCFGGNGQRIKARALEKLLARR
jgi:phage/plasmid-like protein (TIGR03299 family)